MGLFSSFGRKKSVAAAAVQQQRAAVEQTMYGGGGGEMNDLGPVALILDNNRLTYHNGHWSAGLEDGST